MAVRSIPNLTPVVFLSPTANLEIVQDGTTYRASAGQIAALATGTGGGGTANLNIINDITTTSSWFPLFAKISSGSTNNLFASDPHYNYIPVEGRLSALRHESTQGIHLNSNTISLSYTIPTGDNGLSAGPMTVQAGAIITVNAGSTWKVV